MVQVTTNLRSKPVFVSGFGDKKSYHLHDQAYGSILGIRDAIVSRKQGFSQTTVVLDPVKVEGLTNLQKLVLADGQPSPFGGVVTGNTVTIYRD